MPTSRHPSYRGLGKSNLIDATQAVRMLSGGDVTTAQGWRRYDQARTRAVNRLRPVTIDPVRFNVDDVRRLAATPDDSHVHLEDPLRPMRGVLFACAIGGVMLGLVAFNVWYWVLRP